MPYKNCFFDFFWKSLFSGEKLGIELTALTFTFFFYMWHGKLVNISDH